MHPLHLPSPASPDPFLTQVSFTPSQLLLLEIGDFSVFQTSISLSPLTDLTDTCQQTSKVAEGKLKRQHGHVCLLPFSSQRHHITVTTKAQLYLLTFYTETRLRTDKVH